MFSFKPEPDSPISTASGAYRIMRAHWDQLVREVAEARDGGFTPSVEVVATGIIAALRLLPWPGAIPAVVDELGEDLEVWDDLEPDCLVRDCFEAVEAVANTCFVKLE